MRKTKVGYAIMLTTVLTTAYGIADEPVAAVDDGEPTRCLAVPWCCKPVPCLPCWHYRVDCQPYCRKPLPCLSACDSIWQFTCETYQRKPLPCCLPQAICCRGGRPPVIPSDRGVSPMPLTFPVTSQSDRGAVKEISRW